MILGWGLFNLVEGIIDHQLLELHHVRDMPVDVPAYDWVFLGVGGVVFVGVGFTLSLFYWLVRKKPDTTEGTGAG